MMASGPRGRAAGTVRPTPCRRAEGLQDRRAGLLGLWPERPLWRRLSASCRRRPDIWGRESPRLEVHYSYNPFFAVGVLIWPGCRGLGLLIAVFHAASGSSTLSGLVSDWARSAGASCSAAASPSSVRMLRPSASAIQRSLK